MMSDEFIDGNAVEISKKNALLDIGYAFIKLDNIIRIIRDYVSFMGDNKHRTILTDFL